LNGSYARLPYLQNGPFLRIFEFSQGFQKAEFGGIQLGEVNFRIKSENPYLLGESLISFALNTFLGAYKGANRVKRGLCVNKVLRV